MKNDIYTLKSIVTPETLGSMLLSRRKNIMSRNAMVRASGLSYKEVQAIEGGTYNYGIKKFLSYMHALAEAYSCDILIILAGIIPYEKVKTVAAGKVKGKIKKTKVKKQVIEKPVNPTQLQFFNNSGVFVGAVSLTAAHHLIDQSVYLGLIKITDLDLSTTDKLNKFKEELQEGWPNSMGFVHADKPCVWVKFKDDKAPRRII